MKPGKKYAQAAWKQCSKVFEEATKAQQSDRMDSMSRKVLEVLKKAMYYHFNHFADFFSHYLFQYFCNLQSYSAKVEKYEQLNEVYSHRNYLEKKVLRKVQAMRQILNASLEPGEIEVSKLESVCKELTVIKEEGCFFINSHINSLILRLYEIQGRNLEIIQLGNEGIQESSPIGGARIYYNYLIQSYTIVKKFDQARAASDLALEGLKKGNTYNYIMVNKIAIEFHAQKYEDAYSIFREVVPEGYDRRIPEYFQILKGYFSILARAGLLQIEDKFRIGRFLNEVPHYSRDKSGQNMNILILQILYYLGRDNGRIIDKLDAIYEYNRANGAGRAKQFITALIQLIKKGFNSGKVEFELPGTVNLGIELIPYQKLWEITLTLVNMKTMAK
ncbi:MAG: hypothetical protein AAF990_22175 [Bacteroidota bacterium]